jgi:hypothetical protein
MAGRSSSIMAKQVAAIDSLRAWSWLGMNGSQISASRFQNRNL